ncbi:hypothetical protein GOBAR_DD35815 [Gossypium barbadense]|nr:hypothetical protein GOBAR_DD35815 [Gossypium barbadense]
MDFLIGLGICLLGLAFKNLGFCDSYQQASWTRLPPSWKRKRQRTRHSTPSSMFSMISITYPAFHFEHATHLASILAAHGLRLAVQVTPQGNAFRLL